MKISSFRNKMPKSEDIKSWLDYDANTGIFRWKYRSFLTPANNARLVGRSAGYIGKVYGYTTIKLNGQIFYAHRLAYVYIYGDVLSPQIDVDHINGNRSDNRIQNLRLATRTLNIANGYKRKRKYELPKGVVKELRSKSYSAHLRAGGKRYYLGCFSTPEQASAAYKAAAKQHFGVFARSS